MTSSARWSCVGFALPDGRSVGGGKPGHVLRPRLGRCLVSPRDAAAGLTAGRRHVNLHVTVIGIAPAPAFEQSVQSGDLTEGSAARQLAARIDHAAPQLADVERLSARMLAGL